MGDVVHLLEAPDANGVVADVDAGGGRLGGAAGEVRVANAVEVETVDGVVADEMGDDFDGVGGGIGVAEIEPEFGAEAVALEGDAGGAGDVENGFCLVAVGKFADGIQLCGDLGEVVEKIF